MCVAKQEQRVRASWTRLFAALPETSRPSRTLNLLAALQLSWCTFFHVILQALLLQPPPVAILSSEESVLGGAARRWSEVPAARQASRGVGSWLRFSSRPRLQCFELVRRRVALLAAMNPLLTGPRTSGPAGHSRVGEAARPGLDEGSSVPLYSFPTREQQQPLSAASPSGPASSGRWPAAAVEGGSASAARYCSELFRGDMCCKLWFTATRRHTLGLLKSATDLLRVALVDAREALNSHIPDDVVVLLTGHNRESCCVANHKLFWPYPPTLLKFNPELRVGLLLSRRRGWRGVGGARRESQRVFVFSLSGARRRPVHGGRGSPAINAASLGSELGLGSEGGVDELRRRLLRASLRQVLHGSHLRTAERRPPSLASSESSSPLSRCFCDGCESVRRTRSI